MKYLSSKAVVMGAVALAASDPLGGGVSASAGEGSYLETFTVESFSSGWSYSNGEKYTGRFAVETIVEGTDDTGLKVTKKAQHYGVATRLPKPVDPAKGKTVLQYELKAETPLECGGAYMKFLTSSPSFEPSGLVEDTPYTVMFGPDVCGLTDKVHLIMRYENPKTKVIEEKHLVSPPMVRKEPNVTHVYTAVLDADANMYSVLVDGKVEKEGSLFEDFHPPFLAPEEIPDETDEKPADWVDDAKIPDPEASKPDDWDEDAPAVIEDAEATMPEGWLVDEPKMVDDKEAIKPDDWDDEEDGTWEPPQVPNPKCEEAPGCGPWKRPMKANPDFKGKWTAPLIDNPEFKGVWEPRKVPNPDYVDDKVPLSHIGKIGGVAIEIWTMDEGYFFDNLLVTNDVAEAEKVREELWKPKYEKEMAAFEAKTAEEQKAREKEAAEEGEGFMAKVETSFVSMLDAVLFSSLLAPYAEVPAVAAVYDYLVENPMVGVAGLSALIALILSALLMPKATAAVEKEVAKAKVGQAKKQDITPKDDDDEEEEEEEKEEDVSPTRRSRRTTRRD